MNVFKSMESATECVSSILICHFNMCVKNYAPQYQIIITRNILLHINMYIFIKQSIKAH